MAYNNLSHKVFVYINNEDVSEYLIQGSFSEDSAYTSNIITTRGQVTLGTENTVLDINKERFKIGHQVKTWVMLQDGNAYLHPKGTLYILNSSVNINEQTITLELGCSLAFISDNEEQYTAAVSDLIDTFGKTDDTDDAFVIDKRDLSTLSTLLEVQGYIIYQDQYGYIQKVPSFGSDGIGNEPPPAKFTTFDKYTALSIESISDSTFENDVKAVTVTATVDVPTIGEDEEEEEEGNFPPPRVTSVTNRITETPRLGAAYWNTSQPKVWIDVEQPGVLTSETNPNCGTYSEPTVTSSGTGSNLVVKGEAAVFNRPVKEKVTNGQYVKYDGPGNQVIYEESWEHSSASTWAGPAMSANLSGLASSINSLISEANALISKANQHFDARDDEPLYIQDDNGGTIPNPKRIFHECNANTFLEAARSQAASADAIMSTGETLAQNLNSIYNLSSFQSTSYRYGEGGELLSKIVKTYLPKVGFDNVYPYTMTIYKTQGGGSSLAVVNNGLIGGRSVPSGGRTQPKGYGMDIASQTSYRYSYQKLYTIEYEEFVDYQDSKNNYTKKNYSSSGSRNAQQPDRIIELETESANGQEYCSKSTEQIDLNVTVDTRLTETATSLGWFGSGEPYTKEVSFPLQFVPLLPKLVDDTCVDIDVPGTKSRYEKIVKKYAYILAKKITGDNRGFRVNENLRAEVFEYYPYFPININLETIGQAFSARVSNSNWVFDSNNAVFSFDCFVTGTIDAPSFIDPSTESVYVKTETTKTLTDNEVKIPNTADTITIKTLPTSGTLTINSSPVSAGDSISTSDIESGGLVFTPSGGGTSEISFTFESYDASGNLISINENIYPPESSAIVTADNYFADAGNFDTGTSLVGFDVNGGNFDTNTANQTLIYIDAGEFNTGTAIVLPPPPVPANATSSNDEIDPETELGIELKDGDGNQILTDTLPSSNGEFASALNIALNFAGNLRLRSRFDVNIIDNIGWDYGNYEFDFGTPIDLGTINDPNDYDLDFGTFDTPLDPRLMSSVV